MPKSLDEKSYYPVHSKGENLMKPDECGRNKTKLDVTRRNKGETYTFLDGTQKSL